MGPVLPSLSGVVYLSFSFFDMQVRGRGKLRGVIFRGGVVGYEGTWLFACWPGTSREVDVMEMSFLINRMSTLRYGRLPTSSFRHSFLFLEI